jgi:hypothetical protein
VAKSVQDDVPVVETARVVGVIDHERGEKYYEVRRDSDAARFRLPPSSIDVELKRPDGTVNIGTKGLLWYGPTTYGFGYYLLAEPTESDPN